MHPYWNSSRFVYCNIFFYYLLGTGICLTNEEFSITGKFRKEFRRAFEHCWQPSGSNHSGYQMSTLYSHGDRDSGIGTRSHSRTSRWNVNHVAKLEDCNGEDYAMENLIRRGTKTSVVRMDVWPGAGPNGTSFIRKVTWNTEHRCQYYNWRNCV